MVVRGHPEFFFALSSKPIYVVVFYHLLFESCLMCIIRVVLHKVIHIKCRTGQAEDMTLLITFSNKKDSETTSAKPKQSRTL